MSLVRLWMVPLLEVLRLPREAREPEECHGCRWEWPVMSCPSGRWHHATGRRRRPNEVTPCTRAVPVMLRIVAPGFVAGIEVGTGRCAPILRKLQGRDERWRPVSTDMAWWTEEQIRAYCARRRWAVEVVA